MRCFFHLINGAETIPDDTGIEVSDLESARACALDVINDLRQEAEYGPQDWKGWSLNIVCPEGSVLATIALGIALH
ncbi:hypothetical protein [Microvirga sp. TS319]|uniref:DUF6894 family protein n=1 Tax=Microvirga sp. TS319 TaxID=3241165 RepID=UPI003519DA51